MGFLVISWDSPGYGFFRVGQIGEPVQDPIASRWKAVVCWIEIESPAIGWPWTLFISGDDSDFFPQVPAFGVIGFLEIELTLQTDE